jgi:hypothetical protein
VVVDDPVEVLLLANNERKGPQRLADLLSYTTTMRRRRSKWRRKIITIPKRM